MKRTSRRAFLQKLTTVAIVVPQLRLPVIGAMSYSSGRTYYQGTVPVTAAPLTMAAWFNVPNATQNFLLCSLGDFNTNNYFFLEVNGADVADRVVAGTRAGGSTAFAMSSASFSASTWQHGCAVFSAANSRAAYLNGGSSGTNATSATPTGIDYIAVGSIRVSDAWVTTYGTTNVAEVGIWNAALSAEDIGSLSDGFSPSKVRPQSLVFYAPLVRDIVDVRGGLSLTSSGNTVAGHPRRIG